MQIYLSVVVGLVPAPLMHLSGEEATLWSWRQRNVDFGLFLGNYVLFLLKIKLIPLVLT